jgi:hypothetical protein
MGVSTGSAGLRVISSESQCSPLLWRYRDRRDPAVRALDRTCKFADVVAKALEPMIGTMREEALCWERRIRSEQIEFVRAGTGRTRALKPPCWCGTGAGVAPAALRFGTMCG